MDAASESMHTDYKHRTPGTQRTQDAAHRLARYLTHATKTGISPSERRDVLLALQVDASHPHAAPIQLRMPFRRDTETVYVDTSRLPCDHGRNGHLTYNALLAVVRDLARIVETGEPGMREAARRALELANGRP